LRTKQRSLSAKKTRFLRIDCFVERNQ
jgi:hypothetical protein